MKIIKKNYVRTTEQKPVEHDVFDEQDIATHKYVALLSYFGIFCLVPLFLKPDSPFAQFHAKQGLILAIAFLIGSFVFWIPLIGWAAFILLVGVDILALYKTFQGMAWKIPVVYELAEKMAL